MHIINKYFDLLQSNHEIIYDRILNTKNKIIIRLSTMYVKNKFYNNQSIRRDFNVSNKIAQGLFSFLQVSNIHMFFMRLLKSSYSYNNRVWFKLLGFPDKLCCLLAYRMNKACLLPANQSNSLLQSRK